MKIQSAWHFFFFPADQILKHHEIPLGLKLVYYSIFYWPIASHLPSVAFCVFGGDRRRCGSSAKFCFGSACSHWDLFVKDLTMGVTISDCGINTVGSLQDESEEREGRDPAGNQRAHSTGALYHLCSLYGNGWGAAVGEMGWSGGRTGACRQ